MANTPNLDLEEISLDDNVKTTFINKLNSNQEKIDTNYGYLVDNLLENTRKDTLVEAIEEVNNLAGTISNLEEEVDSLNSIGNAEASDIKSGKKALVQGVEVTGTLLSQPITATVSDIKSGKTAYKEDGTIITGTYKQIKVETVTQTIPAITSNGIRTTTFTFSQDITGARIIYQAYCNDANISTYYSPARYVLMSYDSAKSDYCSCIYTSSRTYYSYAYDVSASFFTFTINGNTLTVTNTNASYELIPYSGTVLASVTAIIGGN